MDEAPSFGLQHTTQRRISQILNDVREKKRKRETNGGDKPPGSDDGEGHAASDADSLNEPSGHCTDEHPHAGANFGDGQHILEKISLDEFVKQRKENLYYPFANKDDWEVAAWLSKSGLSMADIDSFLKLAFVSSRLFVSL